MVTEKWSGAEWQRGKSGTRVFVVTGVANRDAAIAATPISVNDPFPEENRLRAENDPRVRNLGPTGSYEVTWNFVRPDQGSTTEREDDPLDQPPVIRWSKGAFSIQTDVDAAGNPYVNAAGFPFDGGLPTNIDFRILTVTKNQSTYNLSAALAYENRFNSDTVTLPFPISGSVAPGQLWCPSIEPTHDYDRLAEYVNVAYTFWMWEGWNEDGDGYWDSWKHRIVNAGRTGWYDDSGTPQPGNFVAYRGSPLSEPVLLGTDGLPKMSGKFKVEKYDGTYVDPSAPPTMGTGPVFETTDHAVFIKFRKGKPAAFTSLINNLFT